MVSTVLASVPESFLPTCVSLFGASIIYKWLFRWSLYKTILQHFNLDMTVIVHWPMLYKAVTQGLGVGVGQCGGEGRVQPSRCEDQRCLLLLLDYKLKILPHPYHLGWFDGRQGHISWDTVGFFPRNIIAQVSFIISSNKNLTQI